jgi:hypothetical protein
MNYTLDIKDEELTEIYIQRFILEWCKKYHPEVFQRAEKFVQENLDEIKM